MPAYEPPVFAAATAREPNLLARAKANDTAAIATMFAQFLPPDEHLVSGRYMGVLGFWGIGAHSFAGVTERRVVMLRISIFGGVIYQDAALEYANSAAVLQPSQVTLYLFVAVTLLWAGGFGFAIHPIVALVFVLLGLMLLPLTIRVYYRFKKSGLLVWIREGIPLYVFIDRKRMTIANELYRTTMAKREERLSVIGHP
jgi:hypothetical protein